ncbi:MAG: transcriptional regulator BetI [Pseudomonadota bacterium]
MSEPKTKRRAMPAEDRREQLIQATIKCIAAQGLSSTTMAHITNEAGLSMGIVNLHFESKEKLLVETLRHVTDEYLCGWNDIISADTGNAAATIKALLEFEFSASIVRKEKLAVWFAFWGEAKSRPIYQKICAKNDQRTEDSLAALFQKLIDKDGRSGKSLNAALLSSTLTALVDGLWLDLLLTPKQMTRAKANEICLNYLRSVFASQFE